ncbi:MAG: SPOR domain-containing protein [Firmicutes bacterium]|nr:SPOR domain-containing protein [Bacillota bacterium]
MGEVNRWQPVAPRQGGRKESLGLSLLGAGSVAVFLGYLMGQYFIGVVTTPSQNREAVAYKAGGGKLEEQLRSALRSSNPRSSLDPSDSLDGLQVAAKSGARAHVDTGAPGMVGQGQSASQAKPGAQTKTPSASGPAAAKSPRPAENAKSSPGSPGESVATKKPRVEVASGKLSGMTAQPKTQSSPQASGPQVAIRTAGQTVSSQVKSGQVAAPVVGPLMQVGSSPKPQSGASPGAQSGLPSKTETGLQPGKTRSDSPSGVRVGIAPGELSGDQAFPSQPSLFMVQVGAFSTRENAGRLLTELLAKGYTASVTETSPDPPYKVRIGRFPSKDAALKFREELRSDGYEGWVTQ